MALFCGLPGTLLGTTLEPLAGPPVPGSRGRHAGRSCIRTCLSSLTFRGVFIVFPAHPAPASQTYPFPLPRVNNFLQGPFTRPVFSSFVSPAGGGGPGCCPEDVAYGWFRPVLGMVISRLHIFDRFVHLRLRRRRFPMLLL